MDNNNTSESKEPGEKNEKALEKNILLQFQK